jgi:DNA-3-methyladenine glycosylase
MSSGDWQAFLALPTLSAARRLLGALLVCDLPEGRVVGRIVETEAYLHDDLACHGVRPGPDGPEHRRTARNASMFGPPGRAYVYFTYGNHFMFNVVTAPEGVPEAVLIRALEPVEGEALMAARRGLSDPRAQTSGPGKLTQALGINRELDGHNLALPPLQLLLQPPIPDADIVATPRIGLTRAVEHPWRFYLRGNPCVSHPRRG